MKNKQPSTMLKSETKNSLYMKTSDSNLNTINMRSEKHSSLSANNMGRDSTIA